MTHDPLGGLLSRADAVAPVAHRPAADLARGVRAEVRRRQVRARVTFGTLVLLIASAIVLIRPSHPQMVHNAPTSPNRGVETTPPARDAAKLRSEIAALRTEAAGREAIVRAMLDGEKRGRRAVTVPRGVDPLDRILAEQDRGAMALVRQADRQLRELDRQDAAAAGYGRVVELFPKTHWAAVARQRLAEIGE